jgi:hypothetical protein
MRIELPTKINGSAKYAKQRWHRRSFAARRDKLCALGTACRFKQRNDGASIRLRTEEKSGTGFFSK